MHCVRAIELFHTNDKRFGIPGTLEKYTEVMDHFLSEANYIVLISDDEDIQTEDQTFFGGAGCTRDLLGVRRVIDVAQHRMHSFGVIFVSKINFLAGRNLFKALVLSKPQIWTSQTYREETAKLCLEVGRLLCKNGLMCPDPATIELDVDVGQSVVTVQASERSATVPI